MNGHTVVKYSPLVSGVSLAVAFELNFLNPISPEIESVCREYERRMRELVHHNSEEPITRLYEPAVRRVEKGFKEFFIVFPTRYMNNAHFTRLVFRRRNRNERVACARFGESKCFGFPTRAWNDDRSSPSDNYVPLAYPGKTGLFVPLFLKIKRERIGDFLFLKVEAVDDKKNNTVVLRVRTEKEARTPLHLQLLNL